MKKIIYLLLAAVLGLGLFFIYKTQKNSPPNRHTNPQQSVYMQQAHTICKQLTLADHLYTSHQPKKAFSTVENAYWNIYDNILEIQERSYQSPAFIFEVEQQFHHMSHLVQQPRTQHQDTIVLSASQSLCHEVIHEAQSLNSAQRSL